jgi:hypothetical protein
MTYETFLKITLTLQKADRVLRDLYKNNVDLLEFVDPYQNVIMLLIKEVYGEEGADWFSWFCYENDFGQKGVGAWDENENPICHSFESTWEFLEENYNK